MARPMILDLLYENPALYVLWVSVTILSIVLHELGHALAATWEGDATPRMRGHLTWKPWVHMGWLSLALAATIGIAWGLTPVNRRAFRHRRWGDVIVSFAGPAVNLLLAVLGAAIVGTLLQTDADGGGRLSRVFWSMVLFRNVALFVLNMIPVPPLDGFSVLDGIFDLGSFGAAMRNAGNLAFVVLIVVLNLPGSPFYAVVGFLMNALANVFGFEFKGIH
jgi:Zn-dependent protease